MGNRDLFSIIFASVRLVDVLDNPETTSVLAKTAPLTVKYIGVKTGLSLFFGHRVGDRNVRNHSTHDTMKHT